MIEFSPQTMHAIGWTLLHFLWQGAALGALFAALWPLSRNANVRYALGIVTLILMMAAPVVTYMWLNRAPAPGQTLESSAFPSVAADVSSDQADRSPLIDGALAASVQHQDVLVWLVYAWLLGVMVFSVRTAGGLLWLERARHRPIEALPVEVLQQCLILQAKMGLRRRLRFGQCSWLDAPAVLGWFRPIVLVTSQALTGLSSQQLQAIIVHELAHIRRHDALVNLFQVCVEMLLFYHPAVWWVSRRVRIEREVCCDRQALLACSEPLAYARALTLMEEWRSAPSIMMMAANRGPLTERIVRLLGSQHASGGSRVTRVGTSIACIISALLAGNILVAAAQPTAETPLRADVIPPVPAPEVLSPVPAPAAAPLKAPPMPPAPPPPKQVPDVSRVAAPIAPEKVGSKRSSYIDGLAAVGLSGLSVDELISLEVQDITPAYVQSMRGRHLNPNVDQLIALRVQGVTPDYVNQTQQLVADLSIEDVIAMKVHGITPDFIRQMQAAGLDIRVADDFIAAAVHGITPALVKAAVDRGLQDLTIHKLIVLQNTDII
jgi:beta-lactamase regulating signal transducer with metallopeptidase domain